MAKKKTNRFAGRTARSMEKPKNDYGYLKLPDNVNVLKTEGGISMTFDIVPYPVTDAKHMDNKKYAEDAVVGDLWWKRPIKVHKNVGPDEVQIICPTTVGLKCPICEDGARQRKAGMEWDELKEIFPKNRTLFLIVPTNTSEMEVDYTEGEVHVFDQSDYLFMDFLEEEVLRDVGNEGFPDPEDGLSLEVYWRGKKLGKAKFNEASKIDFVERDEQYDDAFIDDLPSLDDMLKILPYKEIEALYLGMEGLDDEDTDDEELEDEKPRERTRKTSRSSSRSTSRRKPREEEPVEEVVEDDPEEKKPARRSTSRRKPKQEEVVEEPEVVEDEPVEEKKPARRKSTRAPAKAKTGKECPFGHIYGEDTDEFDDCDRCKIWESCKETKEG